MCAAGLEGGAGEEGDLLFGCDGLRSRTRSLTFPDYAEPRYFGLLDFGGFARFREGDPLEVGWNVMVFGTQAFFGAFRTPSDEVWWFHNGGDPEPIRELAPAERRARLAALHAPDPAWIGRLIERTEQIIGPWPLHEVVSFPAWHRGRVCLLGDAAHATTPSAGQGASLALEDAMLVSRSLREHRDPQAAFATFERLRRPRVEAIVAQSRRNSSRKAPASSFARWTRDRMLPLFLKFAKQAQSTAYAYQPEW